MRVVERGGHEQEFFEGEPELEPPEELAIGELDEEAVLEEELDNEDVLEEDVDDDVLAASLEDLVHVADDDEDDEEDAARSAAPTLVVADADADTVEAESLDIDDVEESLDRILRLRLAEGADVLEDEDDEAPPTARSLDGDEPEVRPRQLDEFLCQGCFLVRHQTLLVDASHMLCRDCV
jgi:hypothetical protein